MLQFDGAAPSDAKIPVSAQISAGKLPGKFSTGPRETPMTRFRVRPMTFFLPGLFLLTLGVGNILVGHYKVEQYRQVIQNLGTLELPPVLQKASPLRRIQLAKLTETRTYQRRKTALGRLDFYHLVSFGGQVFASLSIPFILIGFTIRLLGEPPPPELEEA